MYLLRTGQFGAMLVTKDNNQNSEYQNNRHGNGLSSMDLRFPFYLGGVPGNVRASPLQVC